MGVPIYIIKSHIGRPFLLKIADEFNTIYPYLRLEFPRNGREPVDTGIGDEGALREKARDLLTTDAGLADEMTVRQLESNIQNLFALPVQVFRKSGKTWIETKMTRDWTLKQQNDRGRELSAGGEG